MNIYKFRLDDDLLGWDVVETYISDFTEEEIASLWEISKNKKFRDRLNYIEGTAVLLEKTFKPLEINKTFSM